MDPLYINVSPSSSKEDDENTAKHSYEDVLYTEVIFPNFYHTESLGQGSYGAVVKCEFRGKLAAAKIAQKKVDYADIHHEAKLLHEFKHENIITLYATFYGKQSGLILELMEGGSLHELLHQQKYIIYQACHVLGWALQVTSALSFLHSHGYVHRDLKPSNMLLTRDYKTLKLCDFGTANDLRTTMTNNRGTAMFMAPEVFRGRKYDQKCDIFSLGIFLWEMITRRRPFNDWGAANPYAVLWQVSNGKRPNRITACPTPVMELVERCWADSPADRPYVDEVLKIIEVLCEIFPNHLLPLINGTTGEQVQAAVSQRFVPAVNHIPPPPTYCVGLSTNSNTRASLPPPIPPPPSVEAANRGHRRGASYDLQRMQYDHSRGTNSINGINSEPTQNHDSYLPNTMPCNSTTCYGLSRPVPNARPYNPCLTSIPPQLSRQTSHVCTDVSVLPATECEINKGQKKNFGLRKLFTGIYSIKKGFCE